ncbi:MAG: helical backbone metal receptor [Thermoflavifilum sp.]|nr:helical backbone metal receptor [Thermoflavifilum sp.]
MNNQHTRLFIDQLGRKIELHIPPSRIISLVPSQTELLFHLGLANEVVGITKFCVHPENWFHTKTRIGGTKQLHIEKIRALHPDLILANKEENEQSQIEQLMQEFPVWISDVHTLSDALEMIYWVGEITQRRRSAEHIIKQIKAGFDQLEEWAQPIIQQQIRVAYLIWYRPWMVAASDTFIDDMLHRCGFVNAFGELSRYPQITENMWREAQPDIVLLSSEPFPFQPKHQAALQAILPHAKMIFVDGEMFSWYGSRLLQSPAYFQQVIQKISQL